MTRIRLRCYIVLACIEVRENVDMSARSGPQSAPPLINPAPACAYSPICCRMSRMSWPTLSVVARFSHATVYKLCIITVPKYISLLATSCVIE
jgi:hypothetical protein